MTHIPVIFDLDGTLINTLPDIKKSLDTAVELVGGRIEENFPISMFVGGGVTAMLNEASRFYNIKNMERLHSVYQEIYAQNCVTESYLYPGVQGLLDSLKRSGAKIAVLTNKEENLAEYVLNKFFPVGFFDFVYGAASGRKLKPSTEGISWILDKLGVSAKNSCYIGDTCIDIMTGKNAGTPVFAVTWGYGSSHMLESSVPDRICKTVNDLEKCIQDFNKSII